MNQAKPTNSSSDSAEQAKSIPLPTKRKSRGVAILFAVLIGWCLLLATGLFQTQASTDIRRPLIMVLTMGTFLGVWALALRSRRHQKQVSATSSEE